MTTFTELNRSHWNKEASTYNSKHGKTAEQLILEIQARRDWIGVPFHDSDSEDEQVPGTSSSSSSAAKAGDLSSKQPLKLLDYACGTGMISRALTPYMDQCIGIDLSENMVTEFNARAGNQNLAEDEMFAYIGNLLDTNDPAPAALQDKKFWGFDLAVVGLGFHHFEDPVLAAKRLAERLTAGGVLLILDFMPHESFSAHDHKHWHGGHGHDHNHGQSHNHGPTETPNDGKKSETEKVLETVKHLGFSEETVKKIFEEAGVGKDFGFEILERDVVTKRAEGDMKRKVFMARGSKL